MKKSRTLLSSSQADDLFRSLKGASSKLVLGTLKFVEENRRGSNDVIFEYDTDHNHAWYLLGLSYESDGNKKKAAQCFMTAAEIWPEDVDAYVAFSNNEENLTRQIEVLEEVVKDRNDPRLLFNLANALIDNGMPERALVYLDRIPNDWSDFSDVAGSVVKAKKQLQHNEPR